MRAIRNLMKYESLYLALNRAASRMDQRWMIQPSRTTQRTAARTNWTMAMSSRPCTSCPSPGIKKLQSAAMTLPADPCCVISLEIKRMNQSGSLFLIEVFSDFKLWSGRFYWYPGEKRVASALEAPNFRSFFKIQQRILVWPENT